MRLGVASPADRHSPHCLPRPRDAGIIYNTMAKAALMTLIRKSEEMLGLLCTHWEKAQQRDTHAHSARPQEKTQQRAKE